MKIIIPLLSALNGLYMLADGLHVILKGKFIGPQKPGPWSILFCKMNIDIFKLGPLFISFGIAWLIFLIAYLTKQQLAYIMGIIISICTLWYFPIGTITSILIFLLLVFIKK